jgi:hypothetical protein
MPPVYASSFIFVKKYFLSHRAQPRFGSQGVWFVWPSEHGGVIYAAQPVRWSVANLNGLKDSGVQKIDRLSSWGTNGAN